MINPPPLISDDLFSREFKAFKKFVEEHSSGEPLVSFGWNDYIKSEEGYKHDIYEQGQKQLNFREWKRSDIGSGRITEAVDSAINKIRLPKNKENNLVTWQTRDEWQAGADTDDLDRACYALYQTDNDPETFDRLVGLLGQRYDLLAYLFFLKDSYRYLPIRPTKFDEVFQLFEVDFKTSKQCSWDNYTTYIDLIQQLAELLSEVLGSEVKLLDAHSFSWMLVSQMQKSKQENPVPPVVDDEDRQFAEARRMQRERMGFVRNRTLATAAKKRDGYKCTICDFSPSRSYGQAHLTTALDCHHLKLVAERYDHTLSHSTLQDVVTVCSNCHRLLHSDRKTLSPDEARNLLVRR